MRKHVMSTQPTLCAIVGILACFKLCTLVSASIRALKIHIHDRFLMIIITMHVSKLVTHTMLLSVWSRDVVGSYFKVIDRSTGRHFADFGQLEHPCLRSLIPGGAPIQHHTSTLIFVFKTSKHRGGSQYSSIMGDAMTVLAVISECQVGGLLVDMTSIHLL